MGSSRVAETIGYFTVMEDNASWVGGLLVLNGAGRPLEFQCTLPIRPSRAHEILFGASLRDHIVSEVIGPTLLKKCRTPISMLCCQQFEATKLQMQNQLAKATATDPGGKSEQDCVVCLVGTEAMGLAKFEDGESSTQLAGHCQVMLNETPVWVPMEQVGRAERIIEQFHDLSDPTEPFERIAEAIREAQSQIARAA